MLIPSALWTKLRRSLDGTGLAYPHAKIFFDYLQSLFFKFALGTFQIDTGTVTIANGVTNGILLSFAVPTGKTLKIWDYGVTSIGADISWNIYNSTDAANVISPCLETILTSTTDPETPLATVAAGKTVEVRGTNGGGAPQAFAAFIRATLE